MLAALIRPPKPGQNTREIVPLAYNVNGRDWCGGAGAPEPRVALTPGTGVALLAFRGAADGVAAAVPARRGLGGDRDWR